ncbi:MAG: beta-xylosidase [Sphingobacteriaceae bacterium]|nr:MAG: beta-xylosidase [Sphingobacteriaceae bacterium]
MQKSISVLITIIMMCGSVLSGQNLIKPVTIHVDVKEKSSQPLTPIWRFFGYDEANYTYMKDGRKLLSELAALSPVPVFVRTHNLLTTGDGKPALKWSSTNAYTEDGQGNPVYNWKLVDSIFDTYIKLKMKPIAQVGFMPEALSTTPESDKYQTTPDGKKVYHYTGWNYPPKDYKKFAGLVNAWVTHCISRYGVKEVQTWYWEIWNEPDISYWKGTTKEYLKLYDFSVDAIKRALPSAKVGGPETTNPSSKAAAAFLTTFLNHVVNDKSMATGKAGIPLDFITFHAKGDPKLIDRTVWMNMGVQMRNIDKGFEIIASYPTLKNLPIIIGESDPEGCAACSEDFFPQNAYRNGTMYSSYTAAAFAHTYDLAQKHRVNLLGAVTWGFEFEDQPWFRGFRDLATNGVDKPVLNIFRMFGMMRGNRVPVQSTSPYNYQLVSDSSVRGKEPDLNGFATADNNVVYVLVWNYHDANDLSVSASPVTVSVSGLKTKQVSVRRFLVDETHSNSYTAWKNMQSPKQPDKVQYQKLEASGKLKESPGTTNLNTKNSVANITFDLARQGVTLLEIRGADSKPARK